VELNKGIEMRNKDKWEMILRPPCFGTLNYQLLVTCQTCNLQNKCWERLVSGRRYHE